MQIFKPTVAPGDLESVAQLTVLGCDILCYRKFDIEVGWIVAPNFYWTDPNGTSYKDSNTHLFVFVRNTQKAAPDNACMVQPAWTCGFVQYVPPGGVTDYPGKVIATASATNAAQVPTVPFAIVYSNGNWWIQYNGEWLGYIDGSWFINQFNSVTAANWLGEVGVYSNPPATQMGSGTCGTVKNTSTTFSAHIYNMLFAESGYTVPALDKSLKSKQTVTAKKYYNGSFYSTNKGTVSNLSYGGPTGCP